MDEALCREHVGRARALLEQTEADALYLSSAANTLYFAGTPMGPGDRVCALIITREAEPWFIVPGFEGHRTDEAKRVGQVLTWEEHESPFKLIADTLERHGLGASTVALDGETWYWVLEGLREALPNVAFINGEPLINRCRMVKNERELAFIEEACTKTGRALTRAIAELREGMTEREFADLIAAKYRELGTRSSSLVQSGPRASDPHIPTGDRRIGRGDAVVLDSGCNVEGFCSDVTRTLMVGDVSDEIRAAWTALKDAQQAAFDAIRPGATCDSVDAAAREWLTARGYGDYFVHRLGHGIGVQGHEYPYLVKGSAVVLEPGVTSTVEPGIYVPGRFGLRIEDVAAVTDNACRILSHTIPRDFERA